MGSHTLGVLQGAADSEVSSDGRCAERVASDFDARAEAAGTALDHPPGVDPVHRVLGECARPAGGGPEEGHSSAPLREQSS